MNNSSFNACGEFLQSMIEKYPDNEKFTELYSRLLEFKSEYDIQVVQHGEAKTN